MKPSQYGRQRPHRATSGIRSFYVTLYDVNWASNLFGYRMCAPCPSQDQRSKDYDTMSVGYRPSHADATYDAKYGIRAVAGGGRSSARETIGRVAAAAVARKVRMCVRCRRLMMDMCLRGSRNSPVVLRHDAPLQCPVTSADVCELSSFSSRVTLTALCLLKVGNDEHGPIVLVSCQAAVRTLVPYVYLR